MTGSESHPLRQQLAQLQHDVAVLRDWTALLDESLHELGNSIDLLLSAAEPRPARRSPVALPHRVRHVRAAADLTLAQLARITHVSIGTLRNIEAKRHRPSPKTLRRLLPALIEMERAMDALTNATPPIDGAHHP